MTFEQELAMQRELSDLREQIATMTRNYAELIKAAEDSLTSTPVLLNYNHRGQMMKRAVEFREINNVKLLPNGNLSRSWNREELDHVIRFPSCSSAPWQDTSTQEGVVG